MSTAFTLPVESPQEEPISHKPFRDKPTMLVVDDEEGPRQSLEVIFKDEFRILLAEDGAEAIELAQDEKIDVAVLDIRMAGMTGIEVLERLKWIDPSIEVIMMTAFETNDTLRQALRLQACDYVNKPFDISTMRVAVTKAMEKRSFNSEIKKNNSELERLKVMIEDLELDTSIARSRGEIYASVIHDINGPLTVISGLLQIINQSIGKETEVAGDSLEQVKDRLKRITRQVTNCIEVSRRYLELIREGPDENVNVWVNQILGDLGELIRVHPCARNKKLIITPLREDVSAHINGTDLIQILLNLSWNALQCTTATHQVEIQGQLLTEPLDLKDFQDGTEDRFINREGFKNTAPLLSLSVQDNGPGIDPEVMPKIFTPYFSSKPGPTANGTGLGLCIVHRLLKEAHAALHAHSKVGRGTIFTLFIPAKGHQQDNGIHI